MAVNQRREHQATKVEKEECQRRERESLAAMVRLSDC